LTWPRSARAGDADSLAAGHVEVVKGSPPIALDLAALLAAR
jgi:hypothetical protein